jgi:hypothetical protein
LNDAGALGFAHGWQRSPAVVRSSYQINADRRLPFGGRSIRNRRVIAHGGVVHQDIDARKFLQDFLYRARGLAGVTDIGKERSDVRARYAIENPCLRIGQSLLTGIDKHHLAALGTENPSGSGTNARAAARDQSNLPGNPVHIDGLYIPLDRTRGTRRNRRCSD